MSRVIVLEGPDGSGKTTLAKKLSSELGWKYVHMSAPVPIDKPFDYWWARIQTEFAGSTPSGLIIDRLHPSEDVYGGLFRGGSKLTAHGRWLLEGWLDARSAFIVHCLPPKGVVLANANATVDQTHHDRAERVYNMYAGAKKLGFPTALPVFNYDFTSSDAQTMETFILTLARSTFSIPFTHEGIGSPNPNVVLVGDRHGSCDFYPCWNPLVFNGPSGKYLHAALELAELTTKTHVLNAWHNDRGRSAIFQLEQGLFDLQLSTTRRYVALGREAERGLKLLGIEYNAVRHPQSVKRFHFGDLERYVAELRGAAR